MAENPIYVNEFESFLRFGMSNRIRYSAGNSISGKFPWHPVHFQFFAVDSIPYNGRPSVNMKDCNYFNKSYFSYSIY